MTKSKGLGHNSTSSSSLNGDHNIGDNPLCEHFVIRHSELVIHSSFIRHSDFDIRHFLSLLF